MTKTVMLGGNVSIECIGGGNPPPKIVWSKVGRTGGVLTEAHNGLLNLTNVQESDAGDYECVVIGKRNVVKATTNVIVSTSNGSK